MKKIIIFIILFLFPIISFGDFSSVTKNYLFFENINSGEQKYIYVSNTENLFMFRYLFFENYNHISIGDIVSDEWKIIKLESKTDNNATKLFLSGGIDKGAYNLNVDYNSKYTEIDEFSDLAGINTLEFFDLNKEDKLKIIFTFIKLFFGIYFILLLPLHFVIFFCFGVLFFRLYEKYKIKLFKNIYLNTIFFYLLFYIIQIIFGFSFIELVFGEYLGLMFYPMVFGLFNLLLLFQSISDFKKYNKKYPDKTIKYYYILRIYLLLFLIYKLVLIFFPNFNF